MSIFSNLKSNSSYEYGEIIEDNNLKSGYFTGETLYKGVKSNDEELSFNAMLNLIDYCSIANENNKFYIYLSQGKESLFIRFKKDELSMSFHNHNSDTSSSVKFCINGIVEYNYSEKRDTQIYLNSLSNYFFEPLYDCKPDASEPYKYRLNNGNFNVKYFAEDYFFEYKDSQQNKINFLINKGTIKFVQNNIKIYVEENETYSTLIMQCKDLPYIIYIDSRLDYIAYIFKDQIIKVFKNLNICLLKDNILIDYLLFDTKDKHDEKFRNIYSDFIISNDNINNIQKNFSYFEYDLFETFKNSDSKNPEVQLNSLIGLKNVKSQLRRFKLYLLRNKSSNKVNLNMVFSGNPGTGKTTVARLVSKIFYNNNILPKDLFVECSRDALIANFVGQTGPKTRKVLESALGGVLFIDEAYSLIPKGSKDYSYEAIAEIIQFLEEHKGQICVIMAGYTEEMNKLFSVNPGLLSRIQRNVYFEDYTNSELLEILNIQLGLQNYTMDSNTKNMCIERINSKRNTRAFANARDVRNLLEQLKMIQAERTISDSNNKNILEEDFNKFLEENNINSSIRFIERCELFDFHNLLKLQSSPIVDNSFDYLKEAVIALTVNTSDNKFTGTGFIITPDGYAITCRHVIVGATSINARRRIRDRHNNWVETYHDCKLAYVDDSLDFAVIKLENKYLNKFPYLKLDFETRNLVNEYAINLGYPKFPILDNMVVCDCKFVSFMTDENQLLYLADLTSTHGASGSCIISKNTNKVVAILLGKIVDLLIVTLDIPTILKKIKQVTGGDKNE